jgi:hypothetical protein
VYYFVLFVLLFSLAMLRGYMLKARKTIAMEPAVGTAISGVSRPC